MTFHIFNSTPLYVVFSALSFILSRVSFLIAMVLPWKILAVASGVGSAYFSSFNLFDGYDEKKQVAYLGATVIVFFISHLVLDFLFDYLVEKGANKAIEKSNKSGVFNNYRVVAKRVYKYYATFFSALLYVLLAFVLLFFFYPSLLINFTLYVLATAVLVFFLFQTLKISIDKRSSWLSIFYKVWWHIGFIVALVWVITDYWQGIMPVILITFFSLILYRQVLVMTTVIANNCHLIYKNRVHAGQIFSSLPNSLYQHKVELSVEFEQLVSQLEQQDWLKRIVEHNCPNLAFTELDKTCHLVEAGNIAYITLTPQENTSHEGLLIKLFNSNREALAEQELTLLQAADSDWPFMQVLENKKINGYIALICRWPTGSNWLQEKERIAIAPQFRKQLLTCQLSTAVISLYEHSQAGLLDRVENIAWGHLQAYSGTSADKIDWDKLPVILMQLLAEIKLLPKQLTLWPLSQRMTFSSSEMVQIADVTRWAWEPIGSAWPLDRLSQLDEVLSEAKKKREDLSKVSPEKAKIVARLYEFERRCRNKNYRGAVNVLSNLLIQCAEQYESKE